MITTEVHNDDTDHVIDTEDDTDTDQHGETPGTNGAVKTDDDTFDDKFHETDDYSANDSSSQSIVIPVPGGTLRLGSSIVFTETGTAAEDDEEDGETNTGNSSANHETDTSHLSNHDSGVSRFADYFRLLATDPVTGVVTNIQATDNDVDNFTDDFGEQFAQRTGTGNGGATAAAAGLTGTGPAYSDHETADATDNYDNQSHLQISIQGSPTPGVTIDFEEHLDEEDVGNSHEDDTLDSGAPGADHEVDLFGHHDHITETGGGHSNVTIDYSSDDGNGNTVTFHEVDNETNTLDEELDDDDEGEEDVDVAGGQKTGDTEHDTETQNATVDAEEDKTTQAQLSIHTVNPTTGLQTTYTVTDQAAKDVGKHESKDATDSHSTSAADSISGEDDLTEHDVIHDQTQITFSIVGTDANGVTYNLQDTSNTLIDDIGDATDDDTQNQDGSNTDNLDSKDVIDEQSYFALTGSYSKADPVTGITTTITLANSIRDLLHDLEDVGDTHDASSTGMIDSPTATENGSDTMTWVIQQTTTQTNPDGTTVAPPTILAANIKDTRTSANGVITDQGISPTSNGGGEEGAAQGQNAPGSSNGANGDPQQFGSNVMVTDLGGGISKLATQGGTLIGYYVASLDAVVNEIDGQLYIKGAADLKTQLCGWNGVYSTAAFQQGAYPFTIDPTTGDWAVQTSDLGLIGKTVISIPNPNAAWQPNLLGQITEGIEAKEQQLKDEARARWDMPWEVPWDAVGNYVGDAVAFTLGGNWSGVDPNLLGVSLSVGFGITGWDFYKDVGDIGHDIYNWEWSLGHAGNLALDGLGLVPMVGALKNLKPVPDLLKFSDETAEVVGEVGKQAGKTTGEVGKNLDELAHAEKIFSKLVDELDLPKEQQRTLLRDALGSLGTGQRAHHLIPLEAIDKFKDLTQRAARGGFNINGKGNGMLLDAAEHVGGHPRYNQIVLEELASIRDAAKDLSDAEIAQLFQEAADTLRKAIRETDFKPDF